jgi:hypothetical protein
MSNHHLERDHGVQFAVLSQEGNPVIYVSDKFRRVLVEDGVIRGKSRFVPVDVDDLLRQATRRIPGTIG